MRLVRRLIALLVVLAGPAFVAPAFAQASRLDDILARGILRVGTTGDYRPFTALDKASGAYSGFDIDLAQSLGAALGVKVEFVPTSWPSLAKDFESGAFDIAMGGVSVTLDRAKKGFFSAPYMREGKTPIARCAEKDKYQTLAQIDRPGVKVIANPGGTNERFDRANLHAAQIIVYPDNLTIFDRVASGDADLMITDASETRFQQKLHANALCAIHPDTPFDFAEKAYWMPRDAALKAFVDQWLHLSMENGAFAAVYSKWFE
ncbi:transporter substrate-binding domain-containing protein [Methylocapsa sp. S129]|uniref:transporter substrate-binding domain-containing protein n=1 Tax=Methylocapsa sp. S129 TaxID=1641869 RepID=UPI00131DCBDD|nr:transporter substrate-binding domain-containing protein [Methylocapsa sp. S129]